MGNFKAHNPASVAAPEGSYNHGLEVGPVSRLLFISGEIPTREDGSLPDRFEEQCEAVWRNIEAVLASAGMTITNLVKVTTFLTDRSQVEANGVIRRAHLSDHRPALTVVIAQTLEAEWLLEIEAIAAD